MKGRFKDYFVYTSSEKKGFVFLLILLVVVYSGYWLIPSIRTDGKSDFLQFQNEVNALLEEEKEEESSHTVRSDSSMLFNFDPNTIDIEDWQKLGFSFKQAESIIKYRNKYGFSSKKDVSSLYVVSPEKYAEIEPYIQIVKKVENTPQKVNQNPESVKTNYVKSYSLKNTMINSIVEINQADTTKLKSLKGIGSYYASKIVKFREALGGFYCVDQLKEVYGMPEEVIDQNNVRLKVDTSFLHQININTVSSVDLKKHPYVNWNIANSIVQIRESHGDYKSIEEIKKSDLVNDEIYRKIAPYLKLSDN